MAELFSQEWMQGFMERWNAYPELSGALEHIGFHAIIGYGFEDEDQPRGIINVKNGHVVSAGPYQGETLNWDLRASPENWTRWMQHPPGMLGLGMACTSRKLTFKVSDYAAMMKDPRMAAPFARSFNIMGSA